jgi:DNA-binding LacI/PurR family transcriptional regulator
MTTISAKRGCASRSRPKGPGNLEGARLAVQHLIDLGHRRIGYIQGAAGTPSSQRRLAGYRSALEQAGLPVLDDLIVAGDYTQPGGRRAMAALLALPEPPTGVSCANDLSAFGALEKARRSIPGALVVRQSTALPRPAQ